MRLLRRCGVLAPIAGVLSLGLFLSCDRPETLDLPIPAQPVSALPFEALLTDLIRDSKPCRTVDDEAVAVNQRTQAADDDLHLQAHRLATAAAQLEALGFPCLAADNFNRQGGVLRSLRKFDEARQVYLGRALPTARSAGWVRGVAQTFNNLGVIESQSQQLRQALDYYQAAAFLLAHLDDGEHWTLVQLNLGQLDFRLGRLEQAHQRLQVAVERLRQLDEPAHLATALTWLGRTEVALGSRDSDQSHRRQAVERLREAVSLRRQNDSQTQALAATLDALGRAFLENGHYREAESALQEAESLYETNQARFSTDNVLVNLAEVRLRQQRLQEALELVGKVLSRASPAKLGLPDWNLRTEALQIQAEARLALGDAGLAASSLEQAVALFEVLRTEDGNLLDSALTVRRPILDLYLEVLIEQQRWPAAFELIELDRARGLLDRLLTSPDEARRRVVAPELVERQDQLRASLLAGASRLPDSGGPTEPLDLELQQLRYHLLAVEHEIRQSAGIPSAAPLHGEQAQAMLDSGTLYVGYWLAAGRAWLFALELGKQDLVVELPVARALVESSISGWIEALGRGDSRSNSAQIEADWLSNHLLLPIIDRLSAERIVFLVDGPMMALPFSALPDPRDPEARLIESVPVARVSSLSILAALRERQAERRHEQRQHLTIFADPAYGSDDPWPRLNGTLEEAQAIRVLFPTHQVFLSTEASRQNFLSGALHGSRLIHLASHGSFNTNHPELSRLRLATVDRQGNSVDGRVHLTDLNRLQLSASLVVLSGCETAIGQRLGGAGPMAFPSAFLHAGAGGVIASLWPVPDESTVSLMKELYAGLAAGLDPPLALQQAQLALLRGQHADPLHWAAWIFIGDWRG